MMNKRSRRAKRKGWSAPVKEIAALYMFFGTAKIPAKALSAQQWEQVRRENHTQRKTRKEGKK